MGDGVAVGECPHPNPPPEGEGVRGEEGDTAECVDTCASSRYGTRADVVKALWRLSQSRVGMNGGYFAVAAGLATNS